MMTLEEIRHVEFTSGRGYRAEEVDDFIDECVETLEHYRKESDELNQKLKVLADKVAEYRNDEDAIRAALLNAQRTGEKVLREAEENAAAMLAEAEARAKNIHEEAQKQIENEKAELERVRREVSNFKQKMLDIYKEHLAQINVLPEVKEEPAKAEESVVGEEPAIVVEEETVTVAPTAEKETSVAPAEEEQETLSRFSDLQFGEDYRFEDLEQEEKRGLFRKKK